MSKAAKFDRQQVIDKAMELYWEKGFHATSMRNLQDVIDMRPGSIYATFGSKEGLFKEALSHYTQLGIAMLAQCIDNSPSQLAGLQQFVKCQVLADPSQVPSKVCMLAKSVAELTDEHPELLNEAKAALKTMEREFAAVISKAQQLGELPKERDPNQLARHLQVQIAGLRSYAQACDGDAPLEQMIEDTFSHYPF